MNIFDKTHKGKKGRKVRRNTKRKITGVSFIKIDYDVDYRKLSRDQFNYSG